MTSRRKDNPGSSNYRDWPHDLTALQEIGEEIIENWRDQKPNSPRTYPPVSWLKENGYSHLQWILREKHDMGTREFFILLTSAQTPSSFEWGIEDITTIERVRTYLSDQLDFRDWAEQTERSNRYRINKVLTGFAEQYGDDRIIALANDQSTQSDVYEAFKQVGKKLRGELASDDSFNHYLRATHRFFEWLLRANRIAYDPMGGIEKEFRLDWSADPTPITAEQVRRLWNTAESVEERLLVIGFCVWGVRTQELPLIHFEQFFFEDQPYIYFKEHQRKNGAGPVTLMFGLDTLTTHLEHLSRDPDWNGCLFPSPVSGRDCLSGKQMRRKFKDLCKRANVTVNGTTATPKVGRSFYYNLLAQAETDLMEAATEIAPAQGSKDPRAILKFYLTEEQREKYRRVIFEYHVKRVLPEDAYDSPEPSSFDRSLDDFR